MSKDFTKPLEEVVDDAVQSCPIDYRIKLYKNIVLSGGSTLFDGFDKRLQTGLQKRVSDRLMGYSSAYTREAADKEIPCTVAQNIVQRYAVWFGGSVLGSQPNFANVCKSREQYQEYGPSICRSNPIFQN